jgi:translation elongation factor EF-1alpha
MNIIPKDISTGSIICSPKKPASVVRAFEAQLVVLEHKNIICAGYSAVMHIHAAVDEIVIGVSYSSWNELENMNANVFDNYCINIARLCCT